MPYYTVDRIEGQAAVLIGEDGSRVDVPLSKLPQGTREGTVLDASLAADGRPQWESAAIDTGEMQRRRKKGKQRLERWRNRNSGGERAP